MDQSLHLLQVAKEILCGSELSSKFTPLLGVPYDERYHAEFLRHTDFSLPGRSHNLKWDEGERTPFPRGDLHKDYERAAILHFFANHELLALELMALCILRFPNMPSAYREMLKTVMSEEQKHLQSYLTRMSELGLQFGDLRLSGYFWRQMSTVKSIESFIAAMHLTFEQANLDFSAEFLQKMQVIGDTKTAELLQNVLNDEIRHVGAGLAWMNKLVKDTDPWEAYLKLLPEGISPRRARGRIYVRDVRYAAGFSESLADAFAVYSESRGRPATVYWFNGAADWQKGSADLGDLAVLYGLLANHDDIIAVPKMPSTKLILGLRSLGLPEFRPLVWSNPGDLQKNLKSRVIEGFHPWVPDDRALACVKNENLSFRGGYAALEQNYHKQTDLYLKFARKDSLKSLADQKVIVPQTHCYHSPAQILQDHEHLFPQSPKIVLKSIYGGAGQNLAVVDRTVSGQLNQVLQTRPFLQRQDVWDHGVVIEPWLQKSHDGSVLFRITDHGVSFLGITHFYTNPNGRYMGHDLQPFMFDIPPRYFRAWQQSLVDQGTEIAKQMATAGFIGRLGIDFMVCHDFGGSKEYPFYFNEINPRDTMGHIALKLSQKLHPTHKGVFKIVTAKEAKNYETLMENQTGHLPLGSFLLGDKDQKFTLYGAIAVELRS